ncbi:agglutinin isolectin 1-like [Triticum dicoccoides]|uniref:Chitin-binding type-1 domain-containing protein n=1 Tax=Triticum turgidum subsp. durum TaxID=4567 RepID=A0A9R0TFZ0_TRITD|nr:agglutinin isolectin 1-like [Triticum dicoccoides]VAI11702.1 unnamed protein product [Triticum turgidum subsp. durum]
MAKKQLEVWILMLALGALACFDEAQLIDCPKECGRGADVMECPNNLCCNEDGRCGIGNKYCDTGCQNGACYNSLRCDSNGECPNNFCCSDSGLCGLGIEYCGGECKSGPCRTGDKPCVQAPDGSFSCPNKYCCSGEGFCGLGNAYCGVGCKGGPCISPSMFNPVTCLF